MTDSNSRSITWYSAVGLLSSFALLIGMARDWAYITAIDADLLFFLSVDDYFSSSVRWIPILLSSFLVGVILRAFNLSYSNLSSPRNGESTRLDWDFSRTKKFTYLLGSFLALLATVAIFYFGQKEMYWTFFGTFIFFWYFAKELILSDRKFFESASLLAVTLIEYGPFVLALAMSMGFQEGTKLLTQSRPDTKIVLNDRTITFEISVRHTRDYFIGIIPETKEIKIISNKNISEIYFL